MNDTLSSEKEFKVEVATFEDIYPTWDEHLWPDRKSPIKEMSSMTYDGDYDMSIYKKYKPTFFIVRDGYTVVGVNSGHRTHNDHYRSRGLYVNTNYRRMGMSTLLLNATIDQAIKENCSIVWTYPRLTSIRAYKKVGFRRISGWKNEDMEFGPNCLCVKNING